MGGEKPTHLHKPVTVTPGRPAWTAGAQPLPHQLDPGMETATAPEIASRSQRQVEEAADPADARGPQTSHQREAGSPSLQLLPSIEGDPWQSVRVGMLSVCVWGELPTALYIP